MMDNGDTVMFIRENREIPITKIFGSQSKVLHSGAKPLKQFKNKKVLMVTYCAAQKLFAILMEGVLGFCIYQEGGRVCYKYIHSLFQPFTSLCHSDIDHE